MREVSAAPIVPNLLSFLPPLSQRGLRRRDGGAMLKALEAHGEALRSSHSELVDSCQRIDEAFDAIYGISGGGCCTCDTTTHRPRVLYHRRSLVLTASLRLTAWPSIPRTWQTSCKAR